MVRAVRSGWRILHIPAAADRQEADKRVVALAVDTAVPRCWPRFGDGLWVISLLLRVTSLLRAGRTDPAGTAPGCRLISSFDSDAGLRILSFGRIADLEAIIYPGHTRNLFDDRFGQLLRGLARDRSGKSDLALDGGRSDQIVLECLGGVKRLYHVHFNLAVGACPASRGPILLLLPGILRRRHRDRKGKHSKQRQSLWKYPAQPWLLHFSFSFARNTEQSGGHRAPSLFFSVPFVRTRRDLSHTRKNHLRRQRH